MKKTVQMKKAMQMKNAMQRRGRWKLCHLWGEGDAAPQGPVHEGLLGKIKRLAWPLKVKSMIWS